MLGTMEIVAMAGVAVLLFGADKLPKLARSAGEAKKEFQRGQQEQAANAATPPIDPAPAEKLPPAP